MNPMRTLLLAASVAALAACQAQTPPSAPDAAGGGAIEQRIAGSVADAMDKARVKLETQNITIRKDDGVTHKAEITPTGGLIIDGRNVALDDAQRRLVLDYRARTIDIGRAGMDVGVEGAGMAAHAVGEALRGVFSGEPDRIEERIKAREGSLRQAAAKLCDRMPALLASQQALAAAVPEFAPFATMTGEDVDDCRKDAVDAADAPPPPAAPAPPAPGAPTV